MPSQNLTPQLRTRLSRMERLVGLFITLATLLFLFGLGYYVYETAKRKGWFLIKAPYFTFVDNAAGMKEGDKVKLMGFAVGEITEITAMPPFAPWNVFVRFEVHHPFYGYLWKDSRARVASSDFLGGRTIEVTKGISVNGVPTYIFNPIQDLTLAQAKALPPDQGWLFNDTLDDPASGERLINVRQPVTRESLDALGAAGVVQVGVIDMRAEQTRFTAIFDDKIARYKAFDPTDKNGYFLPPDESPALTERLEKVVNLVERNIPNFLDLTNRVIEVMTNVAALTARAEAVLATAQPALTNVNLITAQLSDPDGSLGQWILPANIRSQIERALDAARLAAGTADATVAGAGTNLNALTASLIVSLDNLAQITSNLNAQVQANAFILGDVSDLVRNTDDMVQGLKRHWLLKGPFAEPATPPTPSVLDPSRKEAP